MRRSSVVVLVALLVVMLVSGCGSALKTPNVPDPPEPGGPQEMVLDFDNAVKFANAGEWTVDLSSESPVVIQSIADGITWFAFSNVNLPSDFVFEAEIGVIAGKDWQRPYVGLYIHLPHDQFSREQPNGYRVGFRRANQRYEIDRRAQQSPISTIIAEYGINWQEEPWEYGLEDWRHFKIERKGAQIDVYLNGELIMSAEDATYTGGTVGFYTLSTAAAFRNIRLTAL